MSRQDLKTYMSDYITNPALVQSHILQALQDENGGEMELVDPTNPFIFLLESSVIGVANFMDKSIANLGKVYPVLAVDSEDLYLHMSDEDYLNRFSIPSSAKVSVLLEETSFLRDAIEVTSGLYRVVSIPKDTELSIAGTVFSFDHKVEIRIYLNKTIKVVYVTDQNTEVDAIDIPSNIIASRLSTDVNGVSWISFEVDLRQIRKSQEHYNVTRSSTFKQTFQFVDQYYLAKVYYRQGDDWIRMTTTHTDQVYDPLSPTAVLKVHESEVDIYIPPIYTINGDIGNEVKVIVYTTQGHLDANFSGYEIGEYESVLRDLTDDLTDADNAFKTTTYMIYTADTVLGGRNELSTLELRDRLISNNIGNATLPITPGQLSVNIEDQGYSSLKYMDTLTGRTYIISSDIPYSNTLPFDTEVGTSFLELETSMTQLKLLDTVINNGTQVVLLPHTLYEVKDDGVTLHGTSKIATMLSMDVYDRRDHINDHEFRFSPFFQVIDYIGGTLKARTFQLDAPEVTHVNFFNRNNSLDYFLGNESIEITYGMSGYTVKVHTILDDSIVPLQESGVYAQISFLDDDGARMYIPNNSVSKNEDQTFTFTFLIETNLDFDDQNRLLVNGLKTADNNTVNRRIDLSIEMDFLYGITTSYTEYVQTNMDLITYKPVSTAHRYPMAHEKIDIKLGTYLEHLYGDTRVLDDRIEYLRYEADVPLRYTTNEVIITEDNPVPFHIGEDCEVEFEEVTTRNEIVVDEQDNVIYKHHAGDLVLDPNGRPIPVSTENGLFNISLITLNAMYYFTEDLTIRDYMAIVHKYIVDKSTVDIQPIIDRTLEHTSLLYKPKDALGYAQIASIPGEYSWIRKEQFIKLTLYVETTIFNNQEIREQMRRSGIDALNEMFKRKTVSYSDCINALTDVYGDGVIGISMDGFGGEVDKQVTITLLNDNDRLTLAKRATVTNQNKLSVNEYIEVEFIDHITL